MILKAKLILAYLLILSYSKSLYQIEQRFKERSLSLSKIVLPEISKQSTLQEQLKQYTQLHQSQQFRRFKADPEYSSQILLKKNGSWNQSLYFTGRQLNNLLMEVNIVHKGDHHIHDKDSVSLYLINTATSEFLFAGKIKHTKLFKYEIDSELYQLRVAYDWSKVAETNVTNDEEIMKHISISIDIDPIVPKQEEKAARNDEKAAAQKMNIIKNETDRIFMNSLQIWQEIQKQHQQFFKSQQQVYLRAYAQLVVVFIVNCVEWFLLRKTLKIKAII